MSSAPRRRRSGEYHLETDVAIAAAFAVLAEVELALSDKLIFDGMRPQAIDSLYVLLPVLPLGWRRARPFAAAVGVAAAIFIVGALLGGAVLFFGALFPLLLTIYASAAWSRPPYDRLVLLVPVVLLGSMPWWIDDFEPPYDYIFPGAAVLFAWAVGRAARRWQEQNVRLLAALAAAERARALEAELAVAVERGRIARELHDVVAHSLSVIVLQSSMARLDATGPVAEVLDTVERTGRTALGEMRSLLGVLRSDDLPELGPQPGLEALPQLLDGLRAAGLDIEVTTTGECRALPDGQDVTAYRIVQEALTNALRHGADGRAVLAVDYRPESVRLRISNRAAPVGSDLGGGHGLIGIRERAALFGGRFRSGPDGDGGFETEVELPLSVGVC